MDLGSVAGIYAGAIRHLGPTRYSREQVEAWAGFAGASEEAFRRWVEEAETFVAIDRAGDCIGFAGISERGHVTALFVSAARQRKGIATRLLARVLQAARSRNLPEVTTHASAFSRPLFERFGFSVTEVEHTTVSGVAFERHAMRADIR